MTKWHNFSRVDVILYSSYTKMHCVYTGDVFKLFNQNRFKLFTLTMINPYSANHSECCLLLSSAEMFEASLKNSFQSYQTAPMGSSIIWVYTICLYTCISQYCKQIYEVDDFSRRHFQMQLLLAL